MIKYIFDIIKVEYLTFGWRSWLADLKIKISCHNPYLWHAFSRFWSAKAEGASKQRSSA